MSADNGIYLHKFRKGWAVAHLQAIDNIYFHRGDKKYNYNILYDMFKRAKIFTTRGEALNHALDLNNELGYTEYGICEV